MISLVRLQRLWEEYRARSHTHTHTCMEHVKDVCDIRLYVEKIIHRKYIYRIHFFKVCCLFKNVFIHFYNQTC